MAERTHDASDFKNVGDFIRLKYNFI